MREGGRESGRDGVEDRPKAAPAQIRVIHGRLRIPLAGERMGEPGPRSDRPIVVCVCGGGQHPLAGAVL